MREMERGEARGRNIKRREGEGIQREKGNERRKGEGRDVAEKGQEASKVRREKEMART